MDKTSENSLYSEKRDGGNSWREAQYEELVRYVEAQRDLADKRRECFFKPDLSSPQAYAQSIVPYRQKFESMLGYPLPGESVGQPLKDEPAIHYVATDELGSIYRLVIPVSEGLSAYGILFLPHGKGPHPLVIAQHGGQGTPELCSGFFGSDNYNDMTRRVLRKGFAVFAPQLMLWNPEFGPTFDRKHMDVKLKQLGSSIAAVEIFKIRKALDYLVQREDIDEERIGMIGLSYGGFYTLFTTACEPRIKACLSSCFFNNRFAYDWFDWTWFNSGNTFLDAEIASLVCPRPLWIEVGTRDELFDVKYAGKEMEKVRRRYEALGLGHKFGYREFDGTHELDKAEEGIAFLTENI